MAGLFESWGEPGADELTPERRDELVDKIARAVVDRNLTAPAIFMLESLKPLSFVGSQVMVFLDPLVRSVFTLKGYNDVRLAMEDRRNVEVLLSHIETMDAERRRRLKKEKTPGR